MWIVLHTENQNTLVYVPLCVYIYTYSVGLMGELETLYTVCTFTRSFCNWQCVCLLCEVNG